MGIPEEYRGMVAITMASLLVLGGSFVVFTTSAGDTNTGKLEVVASFYPLYYFTDQIGKDRIDLLMLIPDNAEPHSWEPKAIGHLQGAQRRRLHLQRRRFRTVAHLVPANLKDGATVVDTSVGSEPVRPGGPAFLDGPHRCQDTGGQHRPGAGVRGPGNATFYRANAADLDSRLDTLNQAYIVGLQNRTKNDFITTHEGFNYLAKRYGLVDHGAVGISADAQPSAEDMGNLIKDVQTMGLHYVFAEPIYNDAVIQTIASDTHCTVLSWTHCTEGAGSRPPGLFPDNVR